MYLIVFFSILNKIRGVKIYNYYWSKKKQNKGNNINIRMF